MILCPEKEGIYRPKIHKFKAGMALWIIITKDPLTNFVPSIPTTVGPAVLDVLHSPKEIVLTM